MLVKLGAVGQITEVKDEKFLAKTNFLEHLNAKLKSCLVTGEFQKLSLNLAKATGFINCEVDSQCYRCGKNVNFKLHQSFNELFSQTEDEHHYEFSGSLLNISQMIIDLILLHYPQSVLCNPKCKGRCQKCGKNLNTNKCVCNKELDLIDPANPFNALKKLKLK